MEDTAANLATDAATNGGEGTFTKDKAVTLTDEASVAELTAINTAKGDKTLTYTTVEDTAANLATDAATNSGEAFTKDKLVTVTTAAADVSVAQLDGISAATDKVVTAAISVLQLILQLLKLRLPTKSLSPLLTKHLSLS